jgi:hypothetical protein
MLHFKQGGLIFLLLETEFLRDELLKPDIVPLTTFRPAQPFYLFSVVKGRLLQKHA